MKMLVANLLNFDSLKIVTKAISSNKKKNGKGFVKGSVSVSFGRSLILEEISELRKLAQSKGARKFVPYGNKAYATIIFY